MVTHRTKLRGYCCTRLFRERYNTVASSMLRETQRTDCRGGWGREVKVSDIYDRVCGTEVHPLLQQLAGCVRLEQEVGDTPSEVGGLFGAVADQNILYLPGNSRNVYLQIQIICVIKIDTSSSQTLSISLYFAKNNLLVVAGLFVLKTKLNLLHKRSYQNQSQLRQKF